MSSGKVEATVKVSFPGEGDLEVKLNGSRLSSVRELPAYLRDLCGISIKRLLNESAKPETDKVGQMESQLAAARQEADALRAELAKLSASALKETPKRGRPKKSE